MLNLIFFVLTYYKNFAVKVFEIIILKNYVKQFLMLQHKINILLQTIVTRLNVFLPPLTVI